MNRFWEIINWTNEAKNNVFEFSTYKNVNMLLKEVKELVTIYDKIDSDEKLSLYMVGIVESIAIIYINFNSELEVSERNWCIEFMTKEFTKYDKNLNSITGNGKIDNTGLWIVAEAFSYICDKLTEKEKRKLLTQGLTSCDLDIRLHTAIGIGKYLWNVDQKLAKWCIDLVDYFDVLDSKEQQKNRTIDYIDKNGRNYSKWIKEIRKKLLKINDFSKLINNKEEYSLYSVTEKMMMLPQKYDAEWDNIILKILNRIILAEEEKNDYRKIGHRKNEGYFELLKYYTDFFGNYFYQMGLNDLDNYMEAINKACNNAPYFMRWTLLQYRLLTEKNNDTDKYWEFFNKISNIMIDISKELAIGEKYKYEERVKILSEYIYLNTPWQPVDFEKPPISGGVKYICEFVKNSNNNVIVFEGISSLMYYFPELILKEGLITFKTLSENDIKSNLEKSSNSIFYLENLLHSYVINLENNTITREFYNICENILNALVECASSKAYYIREYLMKSKKII